jgi:hypothetical protein
MNTVRTMHAALIYASNAQHELIDPLLKLQKRAARLALDESISTPSVDLFRKLEWIPIYNLIKMRKILLVFLRRRTMYILAPLLLISKYHLSNLIFPRPNSHTEFHFSILHQMT